MADRVKLTVRLPEAEQDALRRLAEADGRSLSAYIRTLVKREAAKNGIVPSVSRQTDVRSA